MAQGDVNHGTTESYVARGRISRKEVVLMVSTDFRSATGPDHLVHHQDDWSGDALVELETSGHGRVMVILPVELCLQIALQAMTQPQVLNRIITAVTGRR
jgi:hypothetical protein